MWRAPDDDIHLDAALAYLLVLARVNPALPPRACDVRRAVSKMAACAVFLRTLREVDNAHVRWARTLLNVGSAVYDALLSDSSDLTQRLAKHVVGTRRRQAQDGGGHWRSIVDRLARAWLSRHERERCCADAEIVLWAFPRTVAAIMLLVKADTERNLDSALGRAEDAARQEWQLDNAPTAELTTSRSCASSSHEHPLHPVASP